MPISFQDDTQTSDMSYVRVNLPQNKWTIKTPSGDLEDIDMNKGIAIDVKNVVFGWLHIDVGVREFLAWPSPAQPLVKPEGSPHKKGFEVDCWANGREAQFSNNSYGAGQFIAKLYNQVEEDPNFATKIPVVQVTTSTPVVIGKGTSYDVGFNIAKWIDRPTGSEQPVAMAATTYEATPAATETQPPSVQPAGDSGQGNNFGF